MVLLPHVSRKLCTVVPQSWYHFTPQIEFYALVSIIQFYFFASIGPFSQVLSHIMMMVITIITSTIIIINTTFIISIGIIICSVTLTKHSKYSGLYKVGRTTTNQMCTLSIFN